MSKEVLAGIAPFLGIIVGGLTVWGIATSKVERRVKFETRQVEMVKDFDQLRLTLETLEGDIWTLQQEVKALDKRMAVEHASQK